MSATLFRPEARQRPANEGSIVLVRPLSFALLALLAAAVALSAVAYLSLGEYTKKSRVSGLLVPVDGVVRVHSRESAIVREQSVHEGSVVRKGDVLFVLAAERLTASGEDADRLLSSSIASRQASLAAEAVARAHVREQHQAASDARLAAARTQWEQARAESAIQARRVALADASLSRQRELVQRGFVSASALELRETELLAEKSRALSLQRAEQTAAAQVADLEHARRQLAAQHAAERSAEQRGQATLAQEADEHAARRQFAVRAPYDGQVTAIQVSVGQMANPALPLATVVPASGELVAHLYVPSRAVGFIEPGRPVLVRFHAFPYQKFGQHTARVDSVAKAALSPQEVSALGLPVGPDSLYRVVVKLDQQRVLAYGEPQKLQAGMQLEADVLLDRRRLIEWVFEPLFSLSRKLA